jgi:hypothetical protein
MARGEHASAAALAMKDAQKKNKKDRSDIEILPIVMVEMTAFTTKVSANIGAYYLLHLLFEFTIV